MQVNGRPPYFGDASLNVFNKEVNIMKIKVKMLKDGACNPTQIAGDRVDYKKGDVIEVAEHVLQGMVDAGACEVVGAVLPSVKPVETKEDNTEEKPLEKLSKAELVALCEQSGLDATGNKSDLLERLQGKKGAPENKALGNAVENK